VAHHERFDALARGLATNQLSRRQVLKGLAVGIFLSVSGAFGSRYTRVATAQEEPAPAWCQSLPATSPQGPQPTFTKNAANVVKGDCITFRSFVETTGVTDAAGVQHPTGVGYTNIFIDWTKTYQTPTRASGTGVVCLTTTSVAATYRGQAKIALLDWQQGRNASSTCKAYETAIEKQASDHEKVHANDYYAILPAASTAWNSQNQSFTGCGKNAQEAKKEIEKQIDKSL